MIPDLSIRIVLLCTVL